MDKREKMDLESQAAQVAGVFQAHRDPGALLVLLGSGSLVKTDCQVSQV